MKYLVAACTFLLCCSFISFRFVERDEKSWTLFIYPKTGDSTTYIEHRYNKSGRTKEKISNGKWEDVLPGYSITEALYINGDWKREYSYYVSAKGISYSENCRYGTHHYGENSYNSNHPLSRCIFFDNLMLTMSYYNNGLIKSCELSNRNTNECIELVELDSLNKSVYIGKCELHFSSNTDTTFIYDYEIDNVMTIYPSNGPDGILKQGHWKKYNRAGKVIDSVVYK